MKITISPPAQHKEPTPRRASSPGQVPRWPTPPNPLHALPPPPTGHAGARQTPVAGIRRAIFADHKAVSPRTAVLKEPSLPLDEDRSASPPSRAGWTDGDAVGGAAPLPDRRGYLGLLCAGRPAPTGPRMEGSPRPPPAAYPALPTILYVGDEDENWTVAGCACAATSTWLRAATDERACGHPRIRPPCTPC